MNRGKLHSINDYFLHFQTIDQLLKIQDDNTIMANEMGDESERTAVPSVAMMVRDFYKIYLLMYDLYLRLLNFFSQ